MSIDKFGRFLDPYYTSSGGNYSTSTHKQLLEFSITTEGDINFNNKRLTNIKLPQSLSDATSKKYVDENISSLLHQFEGDLKIVRDSVTLLVNKLDQDLQNIRYNINIIEQIQKTTLTEEITRINELVRHLNTDIQSIKNIASDVALLKQQMNLFIQPEDT